MNAYAPYPNDSAHKLLCENRERYIEQSARTFAGRVAELPPTHLHPNPGAARGREEPPARPTKNSPTCLPQASGGPSYNCKR